MNMTSKLIALFALALATGGCGDDTSTATETSGTSGTSASTSEESSGEESSGDGDGDPAGDGDGDTSGDGDGDTSGDGDGDTAGDGDGDTAGDGDGDTAGDGDGDTSGDGDGDTAGDGDGDTSGDGDGDPPPDECDPQQAQGVGDCDLSFGVAWNGVSCVDVSGCECNGVDCNNLFMSFNECEAAFADCQDFAPDCGDLNEFQCNQAPDCSPLSGAELIPNDNNQLCLDPQSFIVCGEANFCAFVFTWACDPGDTRYLFPTSCIPEGWQPCEGPDQDLPPCG